MPDVSENAQVAEFKSIILTVDHTSTIPGPHVIQKTVLSTESLEQTALSLLKYYDEGGLLASEVTIRQFQELSHSQYPCLVYRTPENVQIIMAYATFQALVALSESLLDATTFVLDTVGQIIVETEDAAGEAIPLQVLAWDEVVVAPNKNVPGATKAPKPTKRPARGKRS